MSHFQRTRLVSSLCSQPGRLVHAYLCWKYRMSSHRASKQTLRQPTDEVGQASDDEPWACSGVSARLQSTRRESRATDSQHPAATMSFARSVMSLFEAQERATIAFCVAGRRSLILWESTSRAQQFGPRRPGRDSTPPIVRTQGKTALFDRWLSERVT